MYIMMVKHRDVTPESEERAERYRNWDAYNRVDHEHEDPFKDLIQRDPTVCDHCFVTKYTRVTHEWWRGSFGWSPFERWIPFPENVKDVPADDAAQGTNLACGNCGYRGTKHRPVSKDQVHEFAVNISQTLDMKEIAHKRDVLLHEVQRRNTSENQGKQDSHVFAPAVETAIEFASQG
jgi:hypothetical protein